MSAGEFKYKIVMLGDFAVGKTSLVRRYVYDEFNDHYLTTIGVKVTKKSLQLDEGGGSVDLLLWDIASDDMFGPMAVEYMRGSAGAIIVSDITRRSTFDSLPDHVSTLLKVNPDAQYVFAVNKSDLADENRTLSAAADSYIAGSDLLNKSPYFVTSAKDGRNVQKLFELLAENLRKRS
jgi:small GTP-binding protein